MIVHLGFRASAGRTASSTSTSSRALALFSFVVLLAILPGFARVVHFRFGEGKESDVGTF